MGGLSNVGGGRGTSHFPRCECGDLDDGGGNSGKFLLASSVAAASTLTSGGKGRKE